MGGLGGGPSYFIIKAPERFKSSKLGELTLVLKGLALKHRLDVTLSTWLERLRMRLEFFGFESLASAPLAWEQSYFALLN